MASLTHFAFYPRDWLGDLNVRSLSYESQGVYVTLLALMWQAKDGTCSLPIDDVLIAQLLGMDVRAWKRRVRKAVWHLFEVDVATCTFFHSRLRHEHQRATRLHDKAVKAEEAAKAKREEAEKARSAGDRGVDRGVHRPTIGGYIDPRSAHISGANSAEKHESGPVQGVPTQTQTQTQTQLLEKQKTPSRKTARFERVVYSPEFEAWWSAYPAKRGSKADAAALHAGWIASGEPVGRLLDAARNYAAECQREGREARFVQHASSFLARERQPWANYAERVPEAIGPPEIRDTGLALILAKKAALREAKPPPETGALILVPDKSPYRRSRM